MSALARAVVRGGAPPTGLKNPFGTLAGLFHLGIFEFDRHGPRTGAQESGYLGGVLDQVIGFVRKVHLDQHVAGEELALRIDLATAADLDDVLGGHQDLGERLVEAMGMGLLADAVGHLALEIRVGVDDVPLVARIGRAGVDVGHGRCVHSALASLSRALTPRPRIQSTPKKKMAVRITMIPTITEVIQVSFQLVQVTLRASARTSWRNWIGLNGFFGAAVAVTAPPAGAPRSGVRRRMAL